MSMIEIGHLVLIIVALLTFATVVAVVYYGSKENLAVHVEHSRAQQVWEERAKRVNQARQALVALPEGAANGGGAGSAGGQIVNPDEAEARRQAALARKAARAARSTSGE
ncbi:MAG: hypothetical protein SNJ54_07010 [Anaerolineae bacterium]